MPIDPRALAQELLEAYHSGSLVTVPPCARDAEFDLNAAYQTEAEFAKLRKAAGHKPVGWKVGYANKALWRVLKLETLVWARMYDDTVHDSHAGSDERGLTEESSAEYVLPPHRAPKIEPEIVFKLKEPVATAGLDAAAVLGLVEWLAIGFEIIDCPFPDWQVKPADFVAAFGLHLGLVIGEPLQVKVAAIPGLAEQLASFKLKVSQNGEFVEEGSGRNSLRSPALCLAELGAAMLRRGAETLAAGDLISSGTLTSGHLIAPGDTWRVEVTGLPLAPLTVKVS